MMPEEELVTDDNTSETTTAVDQNVTSIQAARDRVKRAAAVSTPSPGAAVLGTTVAVPIAGAGTQHPGRRDNGTGYRSTEIGTALRFADLHRDSLRYVPAWGWLKWDGRRWSRDETGAVEYDGARATLAAMYAELAIGVTNGEPDEALIKHAVDISRARGLDHVITLARSEDGIVAAPRVFDRDPFSLTVENGTLDLRTGALHPHRPADLITRLAPVTYDPVATAPKWAAFLSRVLPDPETCAWVQRYLGYALTGDVREQVLAFFVGEGANGKSVMLDVLLALFGDYGLRAAPDLVVAKHNEAHPTEIADLHGRRLVVCSEIEQGRMWAESTIKRLTGDATLTARRMRHDFYTFTATHKLIIAANTRPTVRGTDNGIWRRLRLVPWSVTIPDDEQDKSLTAKLIATEGPGILRWLLEGCLAWQRDGLGTVPAINKATDEYRDEQDILGRWMDECCTLAPAEKCDRRKAYDRFHTWSREEGLEKPWTAQTFYARITEGRHGITHARDADTRYLVGIRLRPTLGVEL